MTMGNNRKNKSKLLLKYCCAVNSNIFKSDRPKRESKLVLPFQKTGQSHSDGRLSLSGRERTLETRLKSGDLLIFHVHYKHLFPHRLL